MNNIKKLLFRDIKINIKPVLFKLGIFFILYFLLNIAEIKVKKLYEFIDMKSVIFENFKGCSFQGVLSDNFIFPTKWLLINGFILYIIGDYFCNDIQDNGKYLLIRNKKLWEIFISKIIWAFIIIIVYYIILILISMLLGIIYYSPNYYIMPCYNEININNLVIDIVELYSLTSLTLCVVLYVLSLKLKPIYCFLIDIGICVSSIFFKSTFLIGQHSLLLRHFPFDITNNLTIKYSILYNIILSFIFVLIGIFMCRRKEIF